ncbi:MAG: hypothetical protein QW200_05590 [Ignisphaera sp.]
MTMLYTIYALGSIAIIISGITILKASTANQTYIKSLAEKLNFEETTIREMLTVAGSIHIVLAIASITILIIMILKNKRAWGYIALALSITSLILLAGYIVGPIAMTIASITYLKTIKETQNKTL